MYFLLGRENIEIGFCCFLTMDPICQALLMPLGEKIFVDFSSKHFCRILSIGSIFWFFPLGFLLPPTPIILGTVPVL